MNVLPPGTILQLLYLRERLKKITPGVFIEVGPGSGEITSLLLRFGWKGCSYDLEPRTVERLKNRFSFEITQGRYRVEVQDYFKLRDELVTPVDLIITCMVMEHFNDELESKFMRKSLEHLKDSGLMIGLVPGSPSNWGIEDEIAGHHRRYTRAKLSEITKDNYWDIKHIAGLTYPISNFILPISNFLVRRTEGEKIDFSNLEKTKASGIRNVPFKTHFPSLFAIVLNGYVLTPLHWIQKSLCKSESALVIYFEAIPSFKSVETL